MSDFTKYLVYKSDIREVEDKIEDSTKQIMDNMHRMRYTYDKAYRFKFCMRSMRDFSILGLLLNYCLRPIPINDQQSINVKFRKIVYSRLMKKYSDSLDLIDDLKHIVLEYLDYGPL